MVPIHTAVWVGVSAVTARVSVNWTRADQARVQQEPSQITTAPQRGHRAGALTGVRPPFCADFFSGEMNPVAPAVEHQISARERWELPTFTGIEMSH